jgi:glutathione-independent formaldehyde dehydrogenase
VLNQAMEIIRPAGAIGIPGLYVTEDPGAHDKAAKTGNLSLRLGLGWSKSNSFHTGQTPVLRYNHQLMMALLNDRLPIAKIVNAKAISLEDARRATPNSTRASPPNSCSTSTACCGRQPDCPRSGVRLS